MGQTTIGWTDFTINPIRARRVGVTTTRGAYSSGVGHYCEKISGGCAHCYASKTQVRFGMPEFPGAAKHSLAQCADDVVVPNEAGEVEVFFDRSRLAEVVRRRKPTRWFWCDMSDLCGRWVPDDWISECIATMVLTPHHTHQILTKRPERMSEFLTSRFPTGAPSNIWCGTSIVNQVETGFIDFLRRTPAAVRFLSLEPLLGPISRLNLAGIHWVIIGCESGPNRRLMNLEWAESIVEQCRFLGVPVFVKQIEVDGKVCTDMAQFPESLRYQEFPERTKA